MYFVHFIELRVRGTVKSCFHVINHKECKKTTQNIALYIKKYKKQNKQKKQQDFGLFFIFLFFILRQHYAWLFLGYGIIQVVQKMLLLKRRWPNKKFITLFTSNSKFRLNLTQRVTGSLVLYRIEWINGIRSKLMYTSETSVASRSSSNPCT